ncbi:threonine-phosphate decarboxylase [Rhizobium sp. Root708]|uniref:threonine-phosphate decarboxylase CobD n=1 Tax=Rhizobium sp. Root708 TaxID=1736592 RepID=UPI0006F2CA7D|nr:threonine-phosphate decarboxylase CobD [Rhizobium sp. Root708]KRB60330.1 threonine-phosphate decarboxylase [Rhizobium sp. Root708]
MNAPIVHGGGITAAALLYGGQPEDWLDLSTGINPHPVAVPDISVRAWHRLPDAHLAAAAREAARDYYGSGPILPLPVPGTQSVIQLLPRLVQAGERVAILGPTYGEYQRAFASSGHAIDMVANLEEIDQRHALAVVVNPNNPDGRTFEVARLAALAQRLARWSGVLVVDEAFGDAEPHGSIVPELAGSANVVVFRSFGKFFGLAGLRLGFVVASPEVLDRFEGWLGPWAVSGPALSVAASLLRSDTTAIRQAIAERSLALHGTLQASGLRIVGGTSLFALVEHNAADRLHAHLCRSRILVRKFDYAPNWLRFGLAADAAGDARLLEALQSYNA